MPEALVGSLSARSRCGKEETSSPDERSDIRERRFGFDAARGSRFAHPGYEEKKIKNKEAERRQTRSPRTAPSGARRAPRSLRVTTHERFRARSPIGVPPRRLRQRPNAAAQLQFTRFLGRDSIGAGVTRSLPSQYSEHQANKTYKQTKAWPQTGHRAGRAFYPESLGSEIGRASCRERV